MKKIHELIDSMTKEELTLLKVKIEKGDISSTIKIKLENFKNRENVCPICNTTVGNDNLTLIFGPSDFRQKATFDGNDCLQYFINNFRK